MTDFDKRDLLLFGTLYHPASYRRDGLRYFNKLRRHELRELLDVGIFNLYPWPLYAEYWWFMEKFGGDDQLYLHGFAYSKERTEDHSGIVIEGIGRDSKFEDPEEEKIFRYLFGRADQFDLDPPWVWYD